MNPDPSQPDARPVPAVRAAKRKDSNLVSALLYASESISGLLFSLVTISLIARHFGPAEVARYNVAQSISAILVVAATLGLDQFIIRDMARNPNDARFASSTQAGLLLGWLGYVLLMLTYYSWTGELARDWMLLACVVVSTLFTRVLFVKSYLQAVHQPRPIAISALASRLVALVFLLAGAARGLRFELMMLYLPLQGLVMFAVMALQQPPWLRLLQWQQVDLNCLRRTVQEAAPVILSTFLFYFYSQSDVVMMSHLLDATSVGVYSAAIRLIPLASFIGFSLLATFYRPLEAQLAADAAAFERLARSVLALHFAAGLVLALGVSLLGSTVIHLLYGARFAQSAAVLKIASWSWLFVMPAALLSRLLVMLGLARYELVKMLLVAPVVLGLNYLAITQLGVLGAAAVCVLGYALVDMLIYLLFKPTRHLARLALLALSDVLLHPVVTAQSSMALLKGRH